jgi:MFS family permease
MFTTQWIIILLAKPFTAVWIILVGRGVAGLALGITLGVVPSYIIDISSAMNQGLLALGPQLMFSVGLLFVYVLGALVRGWWLSLFCLALQLPMFALMFLIPDSPQSMAIKGRKEQSKEAI